VRAFATPAVAETLEKMHPLRLSYEMFGPGNPFLGWVGDSAERIRADRRPATTDNPFLVAQEQVSRQIVEGLETWRRTAETASEQAFHAIYGSPALQAALGIDTKGDRPPRKAGKSLLHAALVEQRIAQLRDAMGEGSVREAVLRALVYVGMARTGPDERAFEALRQIRRHHEAMPLSAFKDLLRQQYFMVMIDEEAALAAIPTLLPESAQERRAAFEVLEDVLTAAGPLPEAAAERLARIAVLFDLDKSPDRKMASEASADAGVHPLGPRARSAVPR
jgi:hypothetical protein